MFAILLHGMQGTPYIYQGEELGMTNVRYHIEDYRDIEILNLYRERTEAGYKKSDVMESIYTKGRDNARTPMQWNQGKEAGFTEGTPWIKVNPNYTKINAEAALADDTSIFYLYQKLIELRKTYDVFADGKYRLLLPEDPDIFAYTRTLEKTVLLVVCNFYSNKVLLPLPKEFDCEKKLLASSYTDEGLPNELRPYEARMYLIG